MNSIFRINIFYNEGVTKDGKKYKVPHTVDFGYNMTVQINNQNNENLQNKLIQQIENSFC